MFYITIVTQNIRECGLIVDVICYSLFEYYNSLLPVLYQSRV